MFLRSGRNISTRLQVKAVYLPAPNIKSSLGSSHLTPTPALYSASKGPRRSSVTINPSELAQKIPCASLTKSASNISRGESQLPSLRSRKSQGKLQSRHETVRVKCYVVQLFEMLGIDLFLQETAVKVQQLLSANCHLRAVEILPHI